ncbi:MAG: NAD-dependent epimerase/dehydratase family protein [Verrucomicrobia bacterium]|nr:NAD-dependent epimerase/dehydratase family protein [Verrucomicrobiota bacterium]
MKILITGVCGFVGSEIAKGLLVSCEGLTIFGIDNYSRAGSRLNKAPLEALGVELIEGDIRNPEDLAKVPRVDWVLDAAANPSVLAGVQGATGSYELLDHNLIGTIRLLEFCKQHGAGFLLLSTSRVYSIPPLAAFPVEVHNNAYRPVFEHSSPLQVELPGRCSASVTAGFKSHPSSVSNLGITEEFSTEPPLSLYGTSKRASEMLALEYGAAFGFPVWINRCGVMAGAGQFGKADQGIFSFWIHRWARGLPLRYIGFGGEGHQVRDCLHPRDLISLLLRQIEKPSATAPRTINLSGGIQSAMSLAGLSAWCGARLGVRAVEADETPRPFDLPWVVLDSSRARDAWGWQPETPVDSILEEITRHALAHPDWLEITGG